MKKWFYLSGAVLTEVIAALSLKGALEYSSLYVVVVFGYISAFSLLSFTLREGMPLGAAYGIWGACGVCLTAVFSLVLFEEPISMLMTVGIIVVIVGVLFVEIGSQKPQAARGLEP